MAKNLKEPTNMSQLDTYEKPKSKESSPFKNRVTFQLGAEDDEASTDSYDGKYDFELSEMKGKDRFKGEVSKIIQEKKARDDLTKRKEDDDDDDDDINKDLASVTKYLLKKSSIYAVSQVGNAESPYRKILWVIVLTAGLLGCGYEIHRFLTLYFQYPVVINLQVENERTLEFPAVTICNLNRIQKQYKVCLDREALIGNCSVFSRNGFPTPEIPEKISTCSDELNIPMDSNFISKANFFAKYSQLDSSSRQRFGHQFNDLIRNCSFNGEPCSLDYFSYFQSLKYGNCYSFNRFSVEDDTVLKTSIVGIMSGLELTLNFDPDNYVPETSSVGARITIHDPRDNPNPEEEGVNISPGFETTLAMKQRSVTRLPSPYKDHCVNYIENKEIRGNNRNECVKFCMQEENYARCSCIHPSLPHLKNYVGCNMTNTNETCCLKSVLNSIAINGLSCNCPLPCFSTTYDVTLSTAVWPSEPNYFDSYCKECSTDVKTSKSDKQFIEELRQKEGRLKIYYSSLERSTYEQKAMFQDSELYSHLGGQLGLWLGLSIVAAFELVENMIYICKYCSTIACNSKKK